MKTIKTTLFTIAVLLCSISASAHDFEVDGIYYNVTSETDLTVAVTYQGMSYNSYDDEYTGKIILPESVIYNGNTYSVTGIGYNAFSDCSSLTSITIPNSVTSIGSSAFQSCFGLASVTIGNSVTSIGAEAFSGCSKVSQIISYAVEPPNCYLDVFEGIDVEQCELIVFSKSLRAYLEDYKWTKFLNVRGGANGIDDVVQEFVDDTSAPIYNLQGVEMKDKDNLPAGIYIQGGKKIVIK